MHDKGVSFRDRYMLGCFVNRRWSLWRSSATATATATASSSASPSAAASKDQFYRHIRETSVNNFYTPVLTSDDIILAHQEFARLCSMFPPLVYLAAAAEELNHSMPWSRLRELMRKEEVKQAIQAARVRHFPSEAK